MIHTLIKSAFQNGCLSVESEGLIHQILATRCYQQADLIALKSLYEAIQAGKIKREAADHHPMELLALNLAE